MFVGDVSLQNRLPDRFLDYADNHRFSDAQRLHDLASVHGRAKMTKAILFLDLLHFILDVIERGEIATYTLWVLRRDVRPNQRHQILDIVPRLKEEPPYGGIGDFLVHKGHGPVMQPDEFLYILYRIAGGKPELFEDAGNHSRTDLLMPVKGPSGGTRQSFGARLADVVQKRRPAQIARLLAAPLRRHRREVIEDLQRMEEIVFVAMPVHGFDALQRRELRQNMLQQAGIEKDPEPHRGTCRTDDLL